MSATGTANASSANVAAQFVAALLGKLEKTGKLIFKPTDNKAALAHLDNAPGFSPTIWTEKAPEDWTGVAIVNTKGRKGQAHEPQTRVVKFAPMETVFADGSMRSMLYDRYIAMLCREVSHPEAEEAMFASLNGPWAESGNKSYTFQAEAWVKIITELAEDKEGMAKLLNTRTLKQALESAEYAKSKFSGIPQERWVKFLNTMKANAERNGYGTAMFDHFLTTRDIVQDAKKIGLRDFDDNTEALLASLGSAPAAEAA